MLYALEIENILLIGDFVIDFWEKKAFFVFFEKSTYVGAFH